MQLVDLLESGPVRAGLFFALAVLISTALGTALGDARSGLRTGVLVGLAVAAFAYLFVRPADDRE